MTHTGKTQGELLWALETIARSLAASRRLPRGARNKRILHISGYITNKFAMPCGKKRIYSCETKHIKMNPIPVLSCGNHSTKSSVDNLQRGKIADLESLQ
jgi:hypothetical protein